MLNLIRSVSIVALILLSLIGKAQVMPVSATIVMNPPNSPFVSDYYSLESNAFQSYITLNDLSEPSWNVKLIIRIEGQGIVIETKRTFLPLQPINLISGVPLLIDGADLEPYLNVNNLNLQGISAATLNQNGKLPEGAYQFCVEVLDYQTGIPLSFRSCGTAFIFYENPPVLLAPACQVAIQPTDPQNVFFNWQMSGGASPTITANSKYKLFVYELQDENENPYFAVQNSKALLIFESDYQQSTSQTIDFGISNSAPLIPGKRYIYRVRALDAEEKNIYKNDGYSEYCWFFYGYPEDGELVVNTPADKYIFTKSQNKFFNWQTSNKAVAGQEFEYVIVIKEKNIGQTKEQAMDNNPEWHLENQPATTSLTGGDFLLTKEFEYGKNYVWQVKAMTGTQQVAKSPVNEFYAPSVVDQFLAGNFPVKIVTMTSFTKTGTTYSNLVGKGRVQLSSDPTDVIDADFSGITVQDISGLMYMTGGSFSIDLSSRTPKELQPALPENGPAYFYYASGVIDKTGLKMSGRVEWPFPLATSATELQVVKSANAVFVLNSIYALNGETSMAAPKTYNLLEPHDLAISLDASTTISIYADIYSLQINGNILTNPDVKTNDAAPYAIKLYQQPQLFYFNASNLLITSSNYLKPIAGLNMGFMPKSAIIDFSDLLSPDKLSSNPSWKGIYFPEFQVRLFKSGFDNGNQVLIPSNIDFFEDLTSHDFWISNQGLQLKYEFNSNETGITFNKFKTALNGKIKITDNEAVSSLLNGAIKIPVLNESDLFLFEIPINTQGLQLGYLNEDLTLREFVFNPFGGENRVDVSINRAVFADNERLDLEIDAELAGFKTTINGINDFRIYGDNVIGIGSKNGSKKLDTRVAGTYNSYNAYITEVGAALSGGKYIFSYIAEMDMGDDVSGQNGPPVLSISSVTPVGSGVEIPSDGLPEPSIPVPTETEVASSQTITSVEMYIAIVNSVVDISGYIKLKANDPVWGNSFAGGINGKIKIPTEIQAGANIVMGNREGLKFWYFDAWFNDKEGMGLKVGTLFNITAMEARIYHHMSKSIDGFTPDATLAFGAAMYLQVIDPSGGGIVAADIGAELKVYTDGEFTLAMDGDVALLNKTKRTASVSGGAISAVGQAVVEAAVESIGPLTLTIEVAGGSLAVTATNIKAGSLLFTKGDMSTGFSADVSATPKVGFNFSKGDSRFDVNASAAGEFGLGVGIGANHVDLGISGTNGGSLDLNFDGATLAADINRSDRTGNFDFAYDSKALGLAVSPSSGELNLQLSPTQKFGAGFNTAGSAFIGLQFDNNKFSMSGDAATKSGSMGIEVDGFKMDVAGNGDEKSASFALNMAGIDIDMAAKVGQGGNFKLATTDFKLDIEADIPSKTGSLDFSFDGGNKAFYAGLDGGSTGKISFKNGTQQFGIGGNSDGSAGSVSYKDGSNEFSVTADRTNKTGSLVLMMDGQGFNSTIDPDSSFASLKYGAYDFGVGVASSGSGGLAYKDASNSLGFYGNPANKKGEFSIDFSGNKIALSTDIPNGNHSIVIDAGGTKFSGSTNTNNMDLEVGFQNHLVKLSKAPSSSGSDAASGTASYTDGSNTFTLTADPGAGTGSLTVDLNGSGLSSSIDSDSSYATFNSGDYVFGTGYSANGTGVIRYSQPNNTFKISGNPGENSGAIDLKFGTNHIGLSSNLSTKAHSIAVESSGITFSAESTTLNKSLTATTGNYSFYANKESSDFGVGLRINDRTIEGGSDNNIPRIGYIGDGIDLSLATNKIKLSSNGHSLELTSAALLLDGLSVGEFTAGIQKTYTQKIENINTTAILNSGVYSLAFNLGGNNYTITTSDFVSGTMALTVDGVAVELARLNNKYTLTKDDIQAAYEAGEISLQKGPERKLTASLDKITVAYDSYNVSVSQTEVKYADAQNTATLTAEGLSLKRGDNELYVGQTNFGLKMGTDKSVELTRNSIAVKYEKFTASYKATEPIEVAYDVYSLGFNAGKLTLKQGSNRTIEVGNKFLGVDFDGYAFTAAPTEFTFKHDDLTAGLSQAGLSLGYAQNNLFLNETNFGINSGAAKHLILTQSSLEVKYDNYEASFSTSKSLSFTDGVRNFALSTSGLAMSDGDKTISILNEGGLPAIALQYGTEKFELNQKGFAVEYQGKRYVVNETENLKIDIDATRYALLTTHGIKYFEGNYELILLGDENWIELKDQNRSFALSKEQKIVYAEGKYKATLSKDLAVMFTDGARTVTLLDDKHYLTYEQDGYKFGIRGANGAKPGIDFSYSGYTCFVEGERNKDVTVGVAHESFGTISATVDSKKNISAHLDVSATDVYGFAVENGGLRIINGTYGTTEPEHLAGAPSIPASDGPVYLTNSISDDAGGSIRGEAYIFFDSRQQRFMLNAAVAGNSPVCIEGAMALDISPGQFHLDLGTEQQRVEVYPLCSGFGGGGWLGIHNTNVDLGVFVGWRASGGIEIGNSVVGAGISAAASAELGVKANLDLSPFHINSAGVWVDIYAGVYARYWAVGASGSITIAEIRLNGKLDVVFADKTKIDGSLAGSITVLDIIHADFDMSFSTTI
ncbi:MAG TPA: hypothetical protein VGC65_09650 [Bacteroidia bacterium]